MRDVVKRGIDFALACLLLLFLTLLAIAAWIKWDSTGTAPGMVSSVVQGFPYLAARHL